MRAENWQDVEEKERARALHRLSKFFAIPKVSDRKRERARKDVGGGEKQQKPKWT